RVSLLRALRAPAPALFPYTTLFRSVGCEGPPRTIVYVLVAPGPTLPAPSTARTLNVYAPSGCADRSYERGLVHELNAETVVEPRSEEHTSELQSRSELVCRLLLEKK